MMRKCCGRRPELKKYKADFGMVYWYECPNCNRRNSYGANTVEGAEKMWNSARVGKPMK